VTGGEVETLATWASSSKWMAEVSGCRWIAARAGTSVSWQSYYLRSESPGDVRKAGGGRRWGL